MQMLTNSLNPHLTIQDWVLRSYLSKRGRKVHSVLKIKRHFFWLIVKKTNKKGGKKVHSRRAVCYHTHNKCRFWSSLSNSRTRSFNMQSGNTFSFPSLPFFQMPLAKIQQKNSLCSLFFVPSCTGHCSIRDQEIKMIKMITMIRFMSCLVDITLLKYWGFVCFISTRWLASVLSAFTFTCCSVRFRPWKWEQPGADLISNHWPSD